MTLPPELLRAIASRAGGQVTLITGAGCSFEEPTNLPLAGTCSQEVHDRLVVDGVLDAGDCADPTNLSKLADVVVNRTGSQAAIIDRILDNHNFKTAPPNEGYLIAAALLLDGAVGAVVTLNFDLAMTGALSELGAGPDIAIIDGPHDLGRQATRNVYYLHRNANATDPDDWVLTTSAITADWRGQWQQHITTRALAVPVVVFAGLGSPADVLIESIKLIHSSTPNTAVAFQVDPGDPTRSAFFTALELPANAFIRMGWSEFMEQLAIGLMQRQAGQLNQAMVQKIDEDGLAAEDATSLLTWLKSIGLVSMGQLRAKILLRGKRYEPDSELARGLIADLLLTIAMIERQSGASARLSRDGVVEFVREGRTVSAFLVASGCGSRGRVAMEAVVSSELRKLRGRATIPLGAIVGGTTDWDTAVSPPTDIVVEESARSIVIGQTHVALIGVAELRADAAAVSKVAP